jgi:drug/metabolite transporter (DMT)-like permease
MTSAGILLVLLSAFCHAAWNLLSKTDRDPVAFLSKALLYSALAYAPLFIVFQFWMQYNTVYLVTVSLSGLCAGFYFFALAKAYQHGRISVAYPVARSFPILLLTWASLLLHERPSPQGLLGILFIVGGCFVLPMEQFSLGPQGFQLRNYLNRSSLWALLAALCTSFYSLLDKYAASHMPAASAGVALFQKVNYVYLQNLISWVVMAALIHVIKYEPLPVTKSRALVSGLIFLVSYSLIIMALTANPVAYVMSLRQVSILLTTLISMYWLEKNFSVPRLAGVLIIFTGVVLVGLA